MVQAEVSPSTRPSVHKETIKHIIISPTSNIEYINHTLQGEVEDKRPTLFCFQFTISAVIIFIKDEEKEFYLAVPKSPIPMCKSVRFSLLPSTCA